MMNILLFLLPLLNIIGLKVFLSLKLFSSLLLFFSGLLITACMITCNRPGHYRSWLISIGSYRQANWIIAIQWLGLWWAAVNSLGMALSLMHHPMVPLFNLQYPLNFNYLSKIVLYAWIQFNSLAYFCFLNDAMPGFKLSNRMLYLIMSITVMVFIIILNTVLASLFHNKIILLLQASTALLYAVIVLYLLQKYSRVAVVIAFFATLSILLLSNRYYPFYNISLIANDVLQCTVWMVLSVMVLRHYFKTTMHVMYYLPWVLLLSISGFAIIHVLLMPSASYYFLIKPHWQLLLSIVLLIGILPLCIPHLIRTIRGKRI